MLLPSALRISEICDRSVWSLRIGKYEICRAYGDGFENFAVGVAKFLAFFHVFLAALGSEPMAFDGPAGQGRKQERRRRKGKAGEE